MTDIVYEIDGLTKTFGRKTVVNDVSFSVERGEMFGILGPNGSGKTTSIRMSLGIIRPDSGTVTILGSHPQRSVLRKVGYLPEERGLPKTKKVIDSLRYLGRLKGMTSTEAVDSATALLDRVGMLEHKLKKIDQLSRGMTQMIQFVAALIHDPEFIILDEPFAGLDPLNVELMKEILHERQRSGTTIMFSTHIMSDVEELCERVALISDGKRLLFGNLAQIRREHGTKSIQVDAEDIPDRLQVHNPKSMGNGTVEYLIEDDRTADSILQSYSEAGIRVDRYERMLPSLNDIFIEEVANARTIS